MEMAQDSVMRFEMQRFAKPLNTIGNVPDEPIFRVNRSRSISSRTSRESNGVSGRVMRTIPALLLDTIPSFCSKSLIR